MTIPLQSKIYMQKGSDSFDRIFIHFQDDFSVPSFQNQKEIDLSTCILRVLVLELAGNVFCRKYTCKEALTILIEFSFICSAIFLFHQCYIERKSTYRPVSCAYLFPSLSGTNSVENIHARRLCDNFHRLFIYFFYIEINSSRTSVWRREFSV